MLHYPQQYQINVNLLQDVWKVSSVLWRFQLFRGLFVCWKLFKLVFKQTTRNCIYKIQLFGISQEAWKLQSGRLAQTYVLRWIFSIKSSLCIKETEDTSVKRFEEKYTFHHMKHPSSELICSPCPNLEQLDTISCLHVQGWMMQTMWNNFTTPAVKIVPTFWNMNYVIKAWTEYSLDPKPIENLSGIVKNKLAKKQPTWTEALREVIKNVWTKWLRLSILTTFFSA